MSWHESKWVKFLEGYCKGQSQIQDEYVRKVAKKLNVEPLQINFPWQQEVVDQFTSSHKPQLIILTGTAGDGKTKLARDIVESLQGSDFSESDWNKKSFFNSPTEIIVKDYSELTLEEKNNIIKELINVYKKKEIKKRILIAVNDGILAESLNHFIENELSEDEREVATNIKRIIEDKINLGISDEDQSSLYSLINLSKLNAKKNLEMIFDSIIDNDGWNDCSSCIGNVEKTCPILRKKELLKENKNIVENLSNIILLLQLNNEHFTIRELLNLAANTLLASKPKHESLQLLDVTYNQDTLRCRNIAKSYEQIDQINKESSIEVGFWGMNLGINKMKDSRPFSEINKLDFGLHSSNYWDTKIREDSRDFFIPIDDINADKKDEKNTFLTRSRIQMYCYQHNDDNAYYLQRYTSFKEYYEKIYYPLSIGNEAEGTASVLTDLVLALNRVFHGRLISDDILFIPKSGLGSIESKTIFHGFNIEINDIAIQKNLTDESSLSGARIEPYISIKSGKKEVRLALPIELFDYLYHVKKGSPPNIANPRLYKKLLILRVRLSKLKTDQRLMKYELKNGVFKPTLMEG